MANTDCPFLQINALWPHPINEKELMQMMYFANPALLFMLLSTKLDLFMEAIF